MFFSVKRHFLKAAGLYPLGRAVLVALSAWMLRGLAVSMGALPPPPPLADRYNKADAVILADLSDTQRQAFNDISESVSMRVTVARVFKNGTDADLPENFHLAFLVFPESFKHLRGPVADGRYVLFLRRKPVVDANGQRGFAFVLIKPRPYAILADDDAVRMELAEIAAESGMPGVPDEPESSDLPEIESNNE